MTIDISPEEEARHIGLPPPGRHLAEVRHAEEKTTRNGDAAMLVTFKDPTTGAKLCEDWLTFGGQAYSIAKMKLVALGAIKSEDKGLKITPVGLIGLRVWLHLKHETFRGQTSAKPDFNAEGARFGYEQVNKADEAAHVGTDEVPF